jgi:hypothetical protein
MFCLCASSLDDKNFLSEVYPVISVDLICALPCQLESPLLKVCCGSSVYNALLVVSGLQVGIPYHGELFPHFPRCSRATDHRSSPSRPQATGCMLWHYFAPILYASFLYCWLSIIRGLICYSLHLDSSQCICPVQGHGLLIPFVGGSSLPFHGIAWHPVARSPFGKFLRSDFEIGNCSIISCSSWVPPGNLTYRAAIKS